MREVWLIRSQVERVSSVELGVRLASNGDSAPFAQVQGAGLDRFCRNEDGVLRDENLAEVPMGRLYDVRVFGPGCELRAIRRGLEWDLASVEDSNDETNQAERVETYSYRPLVWGTAASWLNGWTIMDSTRVGSVAVPVEVETRVTLHVVEYRAHTSIGNAYPAHTRLAGLESVKTLENN